MLQNFGPHMLQVEEKPHIRAFQDLSEILCATACLPGNQQQGDCMQQVMLGERRPVARSTPAEVGGLGGLLRQRGIVHCARCHRVQAEIELVVPPELEARPRQLVIPCLGCWVTLHAHTIALI